MSLQDDWKATLANHGLLQVCKPSDIYNSPGKFESERLAILYWYDRMLDGCADESGEGWDAFELTAEDKVFFGESTRWAVLEYSDQGFVCLTYSDTLPEDPEPSDDDC